MVIAGDQIGMAEYGFRLPGRTTEMLPAFDMLFERSLGAYCKGGDAR